MAFSFSVSAQTIRRVTNNPAVTGVNIYATVQAAHNAAVAGDIIYLEPTSSNYGALVCTKRLTIIGNGFAEQNNNYLTTPNPPLDGRVSTMSGFEMNNGSQNSVIIGVNIQGQCYIRVPNISIDRCVMGGASYAIEFQTTDVANGIVGRNVTITRCRINGLVLLFNTSTLGLGTNCLITNNIFNPGGQPISGLSTSVIKNNIFNNGITVASSVVSDNIFMNSSTSVSDYNTTNTNSISNNLSVGANGLPTGNGNINGTILSSIFTTSSPNGATPDSGWQLAVGSPAIGTGTGGANIGIFAGSSPFVLSGLPPVPIITNFTTSGVGNTSTPLSVSVTVRGNN